MLLLIFFATFCLTCSAENTIFMDLGTLLDLIKSTQLENIMTTPEAISNHGYTAEIHKVTTDDSYILEMHRIPATPTSPAAHGKPVVFLMHGIAGSSMDWVLMGPEQGLAFNFADAGYDVWMGNARGNRYSLGHKKQPKISDETFWRFSWHEIGYYDLPAMIDHALETTGSKQLIYIGHSQGTTVFFVMTSLRTDYNDKIKVSFCLAPIAYMGRAEIIYKKLAVPFADVVPIILQMLRLYYIPPATQLTTALSTILCNAKAPTQFLCTAIYFSVVGTDDVHINTTWLPTIFSHMPAGASTMQLVHYLQEMKSGRFCHYDYGLLGNWVKYRTLLPPAYNVSKITAPVILFYSEHDVLSSAEDVHQLYNELGNGVAMKQINESIWNHIAYLIGSGVNESIIAPILAIIRNNYP